MIVQCVGCTLYWVVVGTWGGGMGEGGMTVGGSPILVHKAIE